MTDKNSDDKNALMVRTEPRKTRRRHAVVWLSA